MGFIGTTNVPANFVYPFRGNFSYPFPFPLLFVIKKEKKERNQKKKEKMKKNQKKNDVFFEKEGKKEITPGVRALLVYPMNALANDQISRLRELFANYPDITFGCYTGQTKHSKEEALNEFKSLNRSDDNPDPTPLVNELLSREEMKQTPPHILITNYAMMEFLMLRPDDSIK